MPQMENTSIMDNSKVGELWDNLDGSSYVQSPGDSRHLTGDNPVSPPLLSFSELNNPATNNISFRDLMKVEPQLPDKIMAEEDSEESEETLQQVISNSNFEDGSSPAFVSLPAEDGRSSAIPSVLAPPSVRVGNDVQAFQDHFTGNFSSSNFVESTIGVPNSQAPNNYQASLPEGVTVPIILPQQQQQQEQLQQQQPQQQNFVVRSSVMDIPNLHDFEGNYGFSIGIDEKERTNKSPMWLMSSITKKLYTNINKAVPFNIIIKNPLPNEKFYIRATAVFSSAQFLRTIVTRCPNHGSPTEITNHDFMYPEHVVRADHPEAMYKKSVSGRLSVMVPLDVLTHGSDYMPVLLRFMCLGSCVGGINRRPISIILTLENEAGQVEGRKVIDVRVCACPTRDIRTDEQTHVNRGGKRRGSSMQEKTPVPIRKKPKTVEPKIEVEPDDDDRMFYIPVRGRKLYEYLKEQKEVYHRHHPEYAAKYPEDQSTHREEETEDEEKRTLSRMLEMTNSDSIMWDSEGSYSQHGIGGGESCSKQTSQDNVMNGPIMNTSPLSKIIPSISISSSEPLRLWADDVESSLSDEENQDSQDSTKESSFTLAISSDMNTPLVTNSIPLARSSPVKAVSSMPRHIPVMQVQTYQSSSLKGKGKSVAGPRYILTSASESKHKTSNVHKRSNESVSHVIFEPPDNLSDQGLIGQYLVPGSAEILAANVLAEGFKGKSVYKSKSPTK